MATELEKQAETTILHRLMLEEIMTIVMVVFIVFSTLLILINIYNKLQYSLINISNFDNIKDEFILLTFLFWITI